MRWSLGLVAWALLAGSALAQDATYQGKTVKQWTAALKNSDPRVRFQALAALSEAGADAEPAAAQVSRLLKDPVIAVRRAAAGTLGKIGPGATEALAELVKLLENSLAS